MKKPPYEYRIGIIMILLTAAQGRSVSFHFEEGGAPGVGRAHSEIKAHF